MRKLTTIRNCGVTWKLRCPANWDGLAPTGDIKVRFCATCEREVFHCTTDEETIERAIAGDCIARDEPHGDELPQRVMGRVAVVREPTPTQREAAAWRRRERGITRVVDGRAQATRRCPRCTCPVLSFRKTCYVCGYEVRRGG